MEKMVPPMGQAGTFNFNSFVFFNLLKKSVTNAGGHGLLYTGL
jgi:hypothetical protein